MIVLLGLIGVTLLIVRGTVFEQIRRVWPAMLGCAQCAGTWVGAAAGASGLVQVGHGRVFDAVVVGAATSFTAMLADAILLYLLGDPNEKAV